MSIGTFTIVRDENAWIAAHIVRILPVIDEMVIYDGNSTDGTLEIIKAIKQEHAMGGKIKLYEGRDCANLQQAYVELFNDCLHALSTDLAWFAHPDMFVARPEAILKIRDSDAIALSVKVHSFAGEPDGQLYRINGRSSVWKSIYRLRNPDLGAHYAGFYGAAEEDVYFSAITGNQHVHHGHMFDKYPYEVQESGIEVLHFSDVRPLARRLGRMKACLENQGYTQEEIDRIASTHPRVTFKEGYGESGGGFTFTPSTYPAEFLAYRNKYRHLEKTLVNVTA